MHVDGLMCKEYYTRSVCETLNCIFRCNETLENFLLHIVNCGRQLLFHQGELLVLHRLDDRLWKE